MNAFRLFAWSVTLILTVVVAGGNLAQADDSRLHLVLACDDAHPRLGEGFEVNEWALRSTLVGAVASDRLILLNPDHYREGGAPPLTRSLLLEYLAALPVQPDDALVVYLACERRQSPAGQEQFRFSAEVPDEENVWFTREEVLAVLQKKQVRLAGLITDGGSDYTQLETRGVAISTVMPPLTETSPLCESLIFKSRGVLNVASAAPGEKSRYYDNYTALGEIPEQDRERKLVAAQRMGGKADNHDLRYGFIRFAGNPLQGGYFTESLVKTLQVEQSQPLSWEQLLTVTVTEMNVRLRGLPGEPQTVQLLDIPGRKAAPARDPADLLGVEVEPAGEGVKITAIHPEGLAAEYGLKVGGILLTVNGQEVTSSAEVLAASRTSTPFMRVTGTDLDGESFSFLLELKQRPQKAAGEMPPPQTEQPRTTPSNTAPQPPAGQRTVEQPAGQSHEPLRDPVEVGQAAARLMLLQINSIRQELGQQASDRHLRVAVFPFVNSKGQVLAATSDAATALAGELSRELSRARDPALEVVSPSKLAKLPPQLLAGRAAPDDSNGQAVLNALNCDYLVTGQFDATSAAELLNARQPEVTIQLALHVPKLPVIRSAFQAETRSIQTAAGDPIGPFPLELIRDGHSILLQPEEREGLGTVYVAEIPPSLVGQPFALRLTSQGSTVGYRNRDTELDKSRLFGVSLFVNGVCSLGQPFGDGQFGLGWGHWSQTPRHAITAPGYVVTDTASGPQVEPQQQQPEDASVLKIDSYRTPLESIPLAFAIPSSGEGVITVHLFAGKQPGDRRIPRGDEAVIPSHYEPVKLVPWYDAPLLHAPPVLTHRIVYRLKATD